MALRSFAATALSGLGLRSQLLGRADLLQFAGRAFASVAQDVKYAKSHEWAKLEGDVATVGISDHAQAELGDIVYVELPEVGKQLAQGDSFGVVESVKAASDVYAPVAGEVVEVNTKLNDEPATVNAEPYKGGWIMKLKVSNKADMDALLDADAYTKHCDE